MVFAKVLSFFLLMNCLFQNSHQLDALRTTLDGLEEAKASNQEKLSFQDKLGNTLDDDCKFVKDEVFKISKMIQKNKLYMCGAGMQNHVTFPTTNSNIQDDKIKASSVFEDNLAYAPYHGRLFGDSGVGGWSAEQDKEVREWIQVDLGTDTTVFGVSTQGNDQQRKAQEWVTTYKMGIKTADIDYFLDILDNPGIVKIFQGNRDTNTPVTNNFGGKGGITAQIFRIYPLTWNVWPTMRFDLIIC